LRGRDGDERCRACLVEREVEWTSGQQIPSQANRADEEALDDDSADSAGAEDGFVFGARRLAHGVVAARLERHLDRSVLRRRMES
jgi:hypothetical protein